MPYNLATPANPELRPEKSIARDRVRILLMVILFPYARERNELWEEQGFEKKYFGYINDPRHFQETINVNAEGELEALLENVRKYEPRQALAA